MKAILLFCCAALAACGVFVAAKSATESDSAQAAPTRVLLSKGFNGTRLDRRHLNTCHWWAAHGCTIGSNNELEWYVPSQVRVHGGTLRLVAARRNVTGEGRQYRFVSGMVTTGPPYDTRKPKFAFRYGRAKIRAWIPRGRGLWPAFWLLPADRESKPEIDVLEMYGREPDVARMHFHWEAADGTDMSVGEYYTDPALLTGWHTFAVDWRPGSLTWYIDGVRRWRIRGDRVPDEPMYPVINLAVGGDRAGAPGPGTRFPKTFQIDYLRVWR
jgi:beta-glucanase (GH16 family)